MASSRLLMGSARQGSAESASPPKEAVGSWRGSRRPRHQIPCAAAPGWSQPLAPTAPHSSPVSWWRGPCTTSPAGAQKRVARTTSELSDPPDSQHFGQKEAVSSRSPVPAWALTLETLTDLPWGLRVQAGTCRVFLSPDTCRGRGLFFLEKASVHVVFLGIQAILEGKRNRGASWVASFCIKIEVWFWSINNNKKTRL